MDRFPKFAYWNWGSSNIQPHHPHLCSSLALNGTQGGLEVTTHAEKNMADVGNKTRSLEAFGMCLVGGRNDPHWIFHSWASSRSWSNEECILILVVEFLVGTLQKKRRDPERGLQSWFRPAKPETRNPKPTVKVGFELRNQKPETRNRLWRLNFPRTDRNPKPETRNPKPTLKTYLPPGPIETRNPKPETDSEDLPSPGPIETRNPKPTLKTYLPQDRSKPETRNPKPTLKTYLPQDRLKPETRNPKPTLKTYLPPGPIETRNPKPETDSEDLPSPGPIETRNPKPETRNPKPTLKTYLPQDRSKPETRNPKPETWNRLWRLTSPRADRNPKPETDSEDLPSPGPIETRNPKPTAKVGFNRRNPKPETDSESWFQATKPETRNPKPTRIRLLGGSPDRNSKKRQTMGPTRPENLYKGWQKRASRVVSGNGRPQEVIKIGI